MIHIKKFTFNLFEENTYIVWGEGPECIIVDPGSQRREEKIELMQFIENEKLVPKAILLTHAHPDHVEGVVELMEKFPLKTYMDSRETASLDFANKYLNRFGVKPPIAFDYEKVSDGLRVQVGDMAARAVSTPGHSAGGVCWWFEAEKTMFTGDTLFKGCIGRSDLVGGNLDTLLESIRGSLMTLDGDIEIFPGHGPSSSIGYERQTNPFIYGGDRPDDGDFETTSREGPQG